MASSHGSKTDLSSFLEATKYDGSSLIITCFEEPRGISYAEKKYLTRLSVYRNPQTQPDEPHHHSHTNKGFKRRNENIEGCDDEVNDRIEKTFMLITLRDKRNLIQFWSPSQVGKYKLLKTVDQPFGLGIPDDGLFHYRKESERHWFYVDEECEEEDLVPVVRVFRRQLPEWTSDIANYNLENHPLKDCAIRWNLHGYLVLPVFDSATMLCVGVLECITSSEYLDCAYEVQEIHRTLKAANLTSPQAFDSPTSYVNYKNREYELDEIFKILKDVCDIHKLPLAQTWRVSSKNSFVVTGRNIEMTCSSFNSSCIGTICISTSGLPFYVHDLCFWKFREACSEHHLVKSGGVVGRALASHGACFCEDVTKLGEDEYSLVHNARMSGLTSCFSICLQSIRHDDTYVLEFFLPANMKDSADLQNLVQNLKLHVKLSSFKFEDPLSIEVLGMHIRTSQQSLSMQLHINQTSMPKEIMHVDSKELRTLGESNAQNDCINVQDQCDFGQVSHKNWSNASTNAEGLRIDDATSNKIDIDNGDKGTCVEKPQSDPLTSEHIEKCFGKSIDQVSVSLGSLSRYMEPLDSQTTIDKIHCINSQDESDIGTGNHKKWSSAISTSVGIPMDDATSNKIDMVNKGKEYNSGEGGASTKQGKGNYLISEKKYYEKSVGEVSRNLGSFSIDKLQIDSQTVEETSDQIDSINAQDQSDNGNAHHNKWNIDITNIEETYVDDDVTCKKTDVTKGKKYNYGEEISSTKRKRKSKMDSVTPETIQKYFGKPIEEASRRFGVSRSTLKRVCRKLNIPSWPIPNRSKKYAHFGVFAVVFLLVKVKRWSCSSNRHGFSGRWWICGRHNAFVSKSNPSAIPHEGMTMCRLLYGSLPLKESDNSIETPTPFFEPPEARLGIHQASQEKNVFNVSDSRMVTVKATFKDDIIKFQSSLSSRLSELKDQVAQRLKLKNEKLHLKYMDEDNDMILIACDADLRNLMPFSATQFSKNTIKLIIQTAD